MYNFLWMVRPNFPISHGVVNHLLADLFASTTNHRFVQVQRLREDLGRNSIVSGQGMMGRVIVRR